MFKCGRTHTVGAVFFIIKSVFLQKITIELQIIVTQIQNHITFFQSTGQNQAIMTTTEEQ